MSGIVQMWMVYAVIAMEAFALVYLLLSWIYSKLKRKPFAVNDRGLAIYMLVMVAILLVQNLLGAFGVFPKAETPWMYSWCILFLIQPVRVLLQKKPAAQADQESSAQEAENDAGSKPRSRSTVILAMISALVVLVAAIVLLPRMEKVAYEGTVTEYRLDDAEFSATHEIAFSGVYTGRIFGKDRFEGDFYLSGFDGPTQSEHMIAIFSDERSRVYNSFWFLSSYGQPIGNSTPMRALLCDGDMEELLIVLDTEGGRSIIDLGASSREEAIAHYEAQRLP